MLERPFILRRRLFAGAPWWIAPHCQSAQRCLATLWGWRPNVQHYRFYKLDPDNSIRGRDEGYHLSDWHALLYARRINEGYAVDIWQGSRRIATVPIRPDEAEQTRMPRNAVNR